jgi:hypothetical protein
MDNSSDEKPHSTRDLYYWFVKNHDIDRVVRQAEILDCQVTSKDNDPYGAVIGGTLTLRTFWVSWPRAKLHPSDTIWSLPPLVNKIGQHILNKYKFEEQQCYNQIKLSFDELPRVRSTYYDPDFYLDVSLAQILRGCRHFALLLKTTGNEGKFVKIGVAELPSWLDEHALEEDGWVMREVTIV